MIRACISFLFLLLAITLTAQEQEHVTSFYQDASNYYIQVPHRYVEIKVQPLDRPLANGRIDKMPDGSLRIIIDSEFYRYYVDEPQLKRLIYYLLAHELLGMNPGKGVMNSEKVYLSMKCKHIERLFKTAYENYNHRNKKR